MTKDLLVVGVHTAYQKSPLVKIQLYNFSCIGN